MSYEEDVRAADPFEARFRFRLGGEALTLTLDEDLNVVEAE